MTKVVLVNTRGQAIGEREKIAAHLKEGVLHRAFSIFILNAENELLIQKRSREKLLWPGYWSNTCCSHPKPKESIEKAAVRRLKQELGFTCPLRNIYTFRYTARYKTIGTEKELCTVLLGHYSGRIHPNLREVEDIQWTSIPKLRNDIQEHPRDYTPWFKMEIKRLWG